MNRIVQRFIDLESRRQKGLVIYIGAGDPDLEATRQLALAFDQAGTDILELGVPFSDPLADGIVNQLAAQRGLASGTTPSRVLDQLHIAEDLGARAVMVSPMLVGLPFFWELCHQRSSLPVLAHPSFGGAQRFATDLLFGRILRWYGADAVIFVGYGGRYGTPRETCRRLAERLRGPEGGMKPALPVPGGGVALENVEELLAFYGRDVMLLVGGSLQLDARAVLERSRAFARAVRGADAG